MRKIILVCMGLVVSGFGLQKPIGDAPAANPYAPVTDMEQARQAFKRFHDAKPTYSIDPVDLNKLFPFLFSGIPVELHSAIARYLPLKYPVSSELVPALENILISPFGRRILLWTALGYEFGLMPYYNYDQGYFYFEQPPYIGKKSVSPVLRGVRRDYRLEDLQRLVTELPDLQKANDLEIIKKAQVKQQELLDGLPKEYKIHLMPTGEATAVIVKLLQALKADPELQKLIAAFKVIAVDTFTRGDKVLARIVVYPALGKRNVQKALDKLYALFKDVRGLDIKPRYNAKVTDLIWIAQGDSHLKNMPAYKSYFEDPKRVYYSKDFTGTPGDYHLVHPETGKEIV